MKMTFDEQSTLNDLTEEENTKLFWRHKLFGTKSKIFTTEDLATYYKKGIDRTDTIKSFNCFKLKFLILILIFLCTIILIIAASFYHKEEGKISYVLTALYVFVIFLIIFLQFFGKRRIFKVTLSKDGIVIKGPPHKWSEIYKIYIIVRPNGNQKFYYLVLALDAGVLQRYEFTNLMNWSSMHIKLSAYIEHYKNLA